MSSWLRSRLPARSDLIQKCPRGSSGVSPRLSGEQGPGRRSLASGSRLLCDWRELRPLLGLPPLPLQSQAGRVRVQTLRTIQEEEDLLGGPLPLTLTISQTHVKLEVSIMSRARLWPRSSGSGRPLSLRFLACERGLTAPALHGEQAFRTPVTPGIALQGGYTYLHC